MSLDFGRSRTCHLQKSAVYEGGDHEIILGRVIDLLIQPNESPLVRQRGQYLTTQPIYTEPFLACI